MKTTKEILSAVMSFVLILAMTGGFLIPAQAAITAVGTASGTQGYDYIRVNLTEGEFSTIQADVENKAYWTLTASGGQTIATVIKSDSQSVVFYLSAVIGEGDTFQLEAAAEVFEAGTDPFAPLDVNVFVPTPADGTATATAGTKDIEITLSSGSFAPNVSTVQEVAFWTLGGASAAANPIAGITYSVVDDPSRTHVTVTLTNDIAIDDTYTITASQAVFVNIAVAPFELPLEVEINPAPDTTPPTVSSIDPADDAVDVPINGDIVITFSEAMNKAQRTVSLTGGSAALNDSDNWTNGDQTLTIGYEGLDYDTLYTITLEFFEDTAGNVLETVSYSFTTMADAGGGNICEVVGGAKYLTLDAAWAAVPDNGTIRLLDDIVYDGSLVLTNKSITLNLNGFNLNVSTTGDRGLSVTNGYIYLAGSGEFNVSGKYYGVEVDGTSDVTVTNAVALGTTDDSYGARATNGGKLTVKGDAEGTECGAYANGAGSRVLVEGNAIATAPKPYDSYGVYAMLGGEVTVIGDAISVDRGIYALSPDTKVTVQNVLSTGAGTNYGVQVESMAEVFILGDCTVNSVSGIGIFVSSRGKVTVNGIFTTGGTYIEIYPDEKDGSPASRTIPSTKTGYHTYSTVNGTVWVKADSATSAAATGLTVSPDAISENGAEAHATVTGTNLDDAILKVSIDGGLTKIGTVSSNDGSTAVIDFQVPANTTQLQKTITVTLYLDGQLTALNTTILQDAQEVVISSAPTWPAGSTLRASGTTRAATVLNWTAAVDDAGVTDYRIYKGGTLIRTVTGAVHSYEVTGLSSSTTYTFRIQAGDADNNWTFGPTVTVRTDSSGSSSGSSGSRGDSTHTYTPKSMPAAQVLGSDGSLIESVTAMLDINKATVTVGIDAASLTRAFDKSKADNKGVKTIAINIPKVDGAKAYEPVLPIGFLSSGDAAKAVSIKTDIATVTVPGNMLAPNAVIAQNVSLTIAAGDKSKLAADIQAQIGSRPVIELGLKIDGKQTTWSSESAPVVVTIPYTPTADELKDPEHITVWYIDGSGNAVSVPSGRYDPASGKVTFSTTHFSKYAVVSVYKSFDDIAGYTWAEKQIQVLASKGILKGISEKEYAPQTNITRADFLYFLVRTLGIDAKFDGNFDDIRKDAYYYKEIGVAKKLGITSGMGNNKFSPDVSITRQDMMVLTEKALRTLKKLNQQSTASDLEVFADKSLVAAYAVDSVASMVKEGLIVGSGDKVNPMGNTTRAEAAVLFYRIYNTYK